MAYNKYPRAVPRRTFPTRHKDLAVGKENDKFLAFMVYLDVHIVSSQQLRISWQTTKRSLYRAANSIFGKLVRVTSKKVTRPYS